MLTDLEIVGGELQGLMYRDVAEYRSRLRTARAAALRLAERAKILLSEE